MSNDIIDAQVVGNDLPAISDENLLAIADRAEKQIAAIAKIKTVALRVTNHNDWTDQGGKPYLQVSGAEKVARVFGISWRISEPILEQETDGHFAYTYKGIFTLGITTIEAIGTRSSKDPFFTRYDKQRDENGDKVKLPPSECDKGDLKKAAYTNCIGNGISRLLGIRNLTWEEVRAGGVDASKVGKVDYGSDEKRGVTGPAIKCPKCGGPVWDNRSKKASGKIKGNAPDAKCKDEKCGHIIWKVEEEKTEQPPAPEMCSECRQVGGHAPSCPNAEPPERTPGIEG